MDDRVLVHGSPPGAGRDLDLLVRPPERKRLSELLTGCGFLRDGDAYVRFADLSVAQVELIPDASFDLPPSETEALFTEGVPLEGFHHLVRPSPAHTLLILARRVVEGTGVLDDKRRGYIDWAIARDPAAWEKAEHRAAAWKAERALDLLHRLGGHAFVAPAVRAAVIEERLVRSGHTRMDARREVVRRFLPERRPTAVVALSGLDGSGKSTQARLLVDALERISIPAATEWAKVGEDRRLWAIRRTGKRLVARLRHDERGDAGDPATRWEPPPERRAPGEPNEVRYFDRGPAIRIGWPLVTLLSNVVTFRMQARRYRGRARVLVYDRYILDTAVHLSCRYGLTGSAMSVAERLAARLAPTPLKAYYLRVEPGVAQARKREDAIEMLSAHADAYMQCLTGPVGRGVTVLDGQLPTAELAARIGTEVWEAVTADGVGQSLLRRAGRSMMGRRDRHCG